jgi:hypothetical protein
MIGLVLACCAAAWAGSPSGLGVPLVGGALSSPVTPGAPGLALNPAAALADRPEILLDVGYLDYTYGFTLTEPQGGGDPESIESSQSSPTPYLAIAVPLGERVGIGLSLKIPYGRSGSGDPEASSRFHSVSGEVRLSELEAAAAIEVWESLVLGAGLRLGKVRYASFKAMDTGATMYGLMGEGAEDLIGDPLFEGTKEVLDGTATPTSISVGFLADFPLGIQVAGGYRTAPKADIDATLRMVPSNDLRMALEGDLSGIFAFPPEAFLSFLFPVGSIQTGVDLGWIGWGQTSETRMTIKDPVIVSDDPALSAMLALYGLNDPTLIGDMQTVGKSGMKDIFTAGAWVGGDIRDRLGARAGAWLSPPTVTDEYVRPGSADYWMVDLRGLLTYAPRDRVTLALAGDWMVTQDREITNSGLDPTNTDPLGPGALPSGNGSYYLNMGRVGMSLLFET